MTKRTEELSAELAFHQDATMIAEGSVLEAIRNGQFDRARAAVDEAEAAWNERLELFEEIAEMVESAPE